MRTGFAMIDSIAGGMLKDCKTKSKKKVLEKLSEWQFSSKLGESLPHIADDPSQIMENKKKKTAFSYRLLIIF
jgi:hypothetical protein